MTTANDASDARSLAESLSRGLAAEHALRLKLGDLYIAVATNSPELVAWLSEYLKDFLAEPGEAEITITALEAPAPDLDLDLLVKTPDPGKTKIKEEYLDLEGGRVVHKRLTGMVMIFGPDLDLVVGPCLENANQVVNFINTRHIQWSLDRESLLFHAAAVSDGHKGLALAGISGAGKSTLALHLVSDGLDFVSNDRLLVQREAGGLTMQGVAKLPRINPGTALNNPDLADIVPPADRERFGALPVEELWALEHKYDVYLDQCFGPGRFLLKSPLAGLVVLTWRHGGGPAVPRLVDLAGRDDLMDAFMKQPGLFFRESEPPRDFSAQAYRDLLAGCPVLEISGGADFPAAVKACRALLAGERL